MRYAFVDMMQDIGRYLLLGLVVAALIAAFVPQEWFTVFEGNTWASMLLVLCISIPMYICATGSIPIAVALMLKGLTPGAALVLLMAGPACNLASILVVNKVMGRKTLALYLISIILGSVSFGFLVDYLQFHGVVNFLGQLNNASIRGIALFPSSVREYSTCGGSSPCLRHAASRYSPSPALQK